jgi:hypothetical protein
MLVTMSVSPGLTGAHLPAGSFVFCRGLEQHNDPQFRSMIAFRQTHAVRAGGVGWLIPTASPLRAVQVPGARGLGRGLVTPGSGT